uniref:Uncharacterized protein n=1 Tax=Oryza punctata TaxID=4537 RepID=A0A0E0M985_ORYPU
MGGDEDDKSDKAVVRRDDTTVAPYRCSDKNSTGGEDTLRRAPLNVPTNRHCGLRGRHSGPKLDGIDAYSMTISCGSRFSRALEQVIKLKMRETE